MAKNNDYELLDFDIAFEGTHAAHKVQIGSRIVWLPKSVCRDMDEQAKTVEVQEWFLVKEELV